MHNRRIPDGAASRTRRNVVAATSTLLAVATAACGQSSPQGAKTPVDHAAFMERTRCTADDDGKMLAPVLGGSAVAGVQPLYSTVGGAKSGLQSELRGATVSVAALPGVTAEYLDRALECYSAKAVLGHGPTASDDPFWLPGASVDIDVRSNKDGFDIAVAGFSPEDAQKILARANAFGKAKTAPPPK